MKYTLNTAAAKAAGVATRITENGKYVGKITRAEAKTSEKGSEGVELSFETDDGLRADYVSIWTHNREGKELGGYKVINALMTVLQLREIEASNGKITEADGKVRDAIVFPQLLKRVGMVMQREEYTKRDGSGVGYEMRLVLPFAADTGMTAREVLERATTAEAADKAVALLQTRKPKTRTTGGNGGGDYGAQPGDPGPGGIPDDDIPFADPYKGRRCYVV